MLAYLSLWIMLGVFFLLQEVPYLGHFFGIVLSFAPFLIIFGSLLLCLANLGLLFFIAPAVALQSSKITSTVKQIWEAVSKKIFSSLVLLFIALIPIVCVVGLLCLAALLTRMSFLVTDRSLTVALEWFFIMIPFCAILSPVVIFFFNFSAESYQLLHRSE